jgi:hypothetical protein
MSLLSFLGIRKPAPPTHEKERNYEAEGLTPQLREAAMESIRRYRAPNPARDAVTLEAAAAAHEAFLESKRVTK